MCSTKHRVTNVEQWNICQEPIDKQNKSDRGVSWALALAHCETAQNR